MSFIGWRVAPEDHRMLLRNFPPKYEPVKEPHCTLTLGTRSRVPLPHPAQGLIIARADDLVGVETLLLSVDGETLRPDGGTYHITWSLAVGRRPRESNVVIQKTLPIAVYPPILVNLHPARF